MKLKSLQMIKLSLLTLILIPELCSGHEPQASIFDLTLEQLLQVKVTVASRRDEVVREAPSVMTIVTRAEIRAFGARNLIDIINRLPGMQVLGHAGFYGNKTQIRAQPNSSQDRHTLILLNGRPVRENINGGNNAYFYLGFPISTIESIEIIRGPGSVLYGSNAFAAVINIKTRRAVPGTITSEAAATYGTYDTTDLDGLVMGCTSNLVNYMAAARVSRSEGPKIEWTGVSGTTDSLNYSDDSDSIYVNIGSDSYELQVGYNRYNPGEFGILGSLTEAVYISEVETFFADAGLTYDICDNSSAHLHLTLNTFTWDGSNDGLTFFERRNSQNLILEPMLKHSPTEDLNLVLGGTMEYDEFGGRELIDHNRIIHSVYAQADYKLTDALKSVAGLQYNKAEDVEGNYSPRFGLVMTPGDHWGAKLLYSEAFRRPSAVEGFLDSSFLLGNTSLEPEIIETYEAQLNYQNHVCQIDLTYFHSQQDAIEVDFTESPLRFINQAGDVDTEGVELTGRFQLGRNWKALGSGMTHSTDNNTGQPQIAPNYPDYILKGGLTGRYGKTHIGLFNSYFSKGSWRHERSNNLQANLSFDVSNALRMTEDRVRLSIYADNLLDEKPFSLPSDRGENEPIPHSYGRRFYATVKVTW